MKSFVFYAACALLACSVVAHPNFGRRHDLIDDEEPFESAVDADFDLVAEESEHFESVVATEPPPSSPSPPLLRGRIKFSNNRYSSLNRLRSSKVTTEAPVITTDAPDTTTQVSTDNEKDERALMLVLPYNAKNMSESKMQELYTKAPITWLINTTTSEAPTTRSEAQTERTSTTIVVTPTPEVKYYRKRITTTTTPPPPIREDIKDVLASIGLFPDRTGSANWRPVTTTTPTPEFVKIATEGFSPDMVNLLSQFGLMPTDSKHNEIPPPQTDEEPEEDYDLPQSQPVLQAEIDPSSYSVFKPIPQQQALSSDMKEFLASFGIVDDDNVKRPRGKQLNQDVTPAPTNIPTLHPESMSEEMKDILHSLGLTGQTHDQNTEKSTLQSRSINSEYIFNPTDSVQNSLNSTEDVENLKKLLQAFRSLASNTSSPEDIEKQLQDANLSQQNFTYIFGYHGNDNNKHSMTLDKYTNAPDPLSLEELLYAINETKNEIYKRQEANISSSGYDDITPDKPFELPSTSTVASSTAAATSTTTGSTTTEAELDDSKSAASDTQAEESSESTTPNNAALLADLESSFGGSTSNEPVDDTLPPPKPNGFYFMLDWNSFLNVGEDDKGVNLKLAPRFGNSRNFLPITVP